jgi:hypothetical protein
VSAYNQKEPPKGIQLNPGGDVMQKIYIRNILRVTFGKRAILFSIHSASPDRHHVADVALTNLHECTLLAYFLHRAGNYARAKFQHMDLGFSIKNLGLAWQGDNDSIMPGLVFGNPDGKKALEGIMLNPRGAGGRLAADILRHLGEERCRCWVCDDIQKSWPEGRQVHKRF